MKLLWNILKACLLQTAILLVVVSGDCTINVNGYTPLLLKGFGSRRIIVRSKSGSIKLSDGETIVATCSTNINLANSYGSNYILESNGQKSVELKCVHSHRLSYEKPDSGIVKFIDGGITTVLKCNQAERKHIYESNKTLPSCEQSMSYGIGVTVQNVKDIKTAAFCYDIQTSTLKYVNYLLQPTKNDFIFINEENDDALQTVDLYEKISDFLTYANVMSQQTFNDTLRKIKSNHELLSLNEFDYTNLLQNAQLQKELNDFKDIFNIMWWRNLRVGNWKLFNEALNERIKSTSYIVYQGTAGAVTMPGIGCLNNETLSVEANGLSVNAPEYIWTYLKTWQTNETEELVVVGYNSPFLENNNSPVFCKDICNEFDWLKMSLLNKYRLMPTRGVVFCCHAADVAQQFENFPMLEEQHGLLTTAAPLRDFYPTLSAMKSND